MKTILVVDDQPNFRVPVATSLRLVGYLTFCATNGEEALEMAESHKPDLILLDVGMPKMDGLTCLKKLRQNPVTKTIPVIMLTAVADVDIVSKAADHGICGYMLKSQFSLGTLAENIEKQLQELVKLAATNLEAKATK